MLPRDTVNDESEESQPLTKVSTSPDRRDSLASVSSVSTTSLVFQRLDESALSAKDSYKLPRRGQSVRENGTYRDKEAEVDDADLEDGPYNPPLAKPVSKKVRRTIWILGVVLIIGWVLALLVFLTRQSFRHASSIPHDPAATASRGSGKQITLDHVLGGAFRPQHHEISWIDGANDEDGLLLERGGKGDKDYLVVEDVRSRSQRDVAKHDSMTLMKDRIFSVGERQVNPADAWPSRSLEQVLVVSEKKSVGFRRTSPFRYGRS